jgi:hypothetical protein
MIAYTITAPWDNGTTYLYTSSYSNTGSYSDAEYGESSLLLISISGSESNTGSRIRQILANGNELAITDEENNSQGSRNDVNQSITYSNAGITRSVRSREIDRDGYATDSTTYSVKYTGAAEGSQHIMTDSNNEIRMYHVLARGSDAEYSISGPPGVWTNYYTNSTFSQFFRTIALQTTTKTTVTNNYKITTTTQEKLAKVGTTITQSIGTSVVTLPTTTNAKSWTENKTTNTTATEDATVVTTSMGIDSIWKLSQHTVYILGKGETTAFLKSDVALNATNGGPTDTAAYDTYIGPTTFTITRVAGTTSQKPVVADTATDTGFIQEEGSETTVTIRGIAAANSTGAYYYPASPHHLPLSSESIEIQTGVSESSTTQLGWNDGTGSWGANAQTTTRSAWSDSSVTYSLAGVSYTEGVPTHTEETYARPTVRSGTGSFSNDLAVAKDYFETEIDGEWVETFSTSQIEGVTGNEGGANGFGEQANYFVNFQNQSRQNNGGGADAFYGLAYAWGTLGGTTATPRQSISVDGIASSESVTWPFVSISAGVQTPKPFVTVSQKPETSATSSTAATKTEITTRRIWGEEFAKTTSSQQTASTTVGAGTATSSAKAITGTSGSTITPIQAGGAALTSFQLGGARGFPVNQLASGWIPAPAMFVIGGIAQTSDSTAIIPPGEYANSTITAPQSFSGSSIANTYFEPKAAVTYLCYPS